MLDGVWMEARVDEPLGNGRSWLRLEGRTGAYVQQHYGITTVDAKLTEVTPAGACWTSAPYGDTKRCTFEVNDGALKMTTHFRGSETVSFFAKVSPQDARALARLEREMERVWRQLADDERMRG